jgi:D-alanine transfer protein
LAFVVIVASLTSDVLVARYIYGLAGSRHVQKVVGLTVQREAFRHDDLLPIYGTSEVDRITRFHPRNLFADAPTGFSAFTVGRPAGLVFTTLQTVGALGSDIRGRKLVVSLSPTMFMLENGPVLTERYAATVFPLHVLTLMLNRDLTAGFRQQFARRLAARPVMLAGNPVVALTARLTADSSLLRRPLYAAFLPVALLQRSLLEAQDKIYELGYILTTPEERRPRVQRERTLDWPALIEDATSHYRPDASNNPFGLEDGWWTANKASLQADEHKLSDREFLRLLSEAESWTDLEQLLQVLRELDARPLILSMPFHGPFLDFRGVSAGARRRYYERVRQLATEYGARVVTLEDHEADPYYFRDLGSHPSPKGWVIHDRVIDAFYHDTLE